MRKKTKSITCDMQGTCILGSHEAFYIAKLGVCKTRKVRQILNSHLVKQSFRLFTPYPSHLTFPFHLSPFVWARVQTRLSPPPPIYSGHWPLPPWRRISAMSGAGKGSLERRMAEIKAVWCSTAWKVRGCDHVTDTSFIHTYSYCLFGARTAEGR